MSTRFASSQIDRECAPVEEVAVTRTGTPTNRILFEAVAFARGVPGLMHPAHDLADSEHAVALLRFAGKFENGKFRLDVEPGARNGRLSVIGRVPPLKYSNKTGFMHRWACRCECGAITAVEYHMLRNRATSSCGCYRAELTQALAQVLVKHGHARAAGRPSEYIIWCGIIGRCTNPNNEAYALYGGRGISICPQWRHSFAQFLADVGRRPSLKYSVDRYPDKDGNYEPGNVRWATVAEQTRNKRSNHLITIGTRTLCVTDWCKLSGIYLSTFHRRIRRGWSDEEAVTRPAISSIESGRTGGLTRWLKAAL